MHAIRADLDRLGPREHEATHAIFETISDNSPQPLRRKPRVGAGECPPMTREDDVIPVPPELDERIDERPGCFGYIVRMETPRVFAAEPLRALEDRDSRVRVPLADCERDQRVLQPATHEYRVVTLVDQSTPRSMTRCGCRVFRHPEGRGFTRVGRIHPIPRRVH